MLLSHKKAGADPKWHQPITQVVITYLDRLNHFAQPLALNDTIIEHSSAADLKAKCEALVADQISSSAYASTV